jgi:hypothetical protein
MAKDPLPDLAPDLILMALKGLEHEAANEERAACLEVVRTVSLGEFGSRDQLRSEIAQAILRRAQA